MTYLFAGLWLTNILKVAIWSLPLDISTSEWREKTLLVWKLGEWWNKVVIWGLVQFVGITRCLVIDGWVFNKWRRIMEPATNLIWPSFLDNMWNQDLKLWHFFLSFFDEFGVHHHQINQRWWLNLGGEGGISQIVDWLWANLTEHDLAQIGESVE